MDSIARAALASAVRQQDEIDTIEEQFANIGDGTGTPVADVGELVAIFEPVLRN